MKTQNSLESLIDTLTRMVEEVSERADNEAWRREFLINPILTSPFALGFQPSGIGAEISYSVSDAEYERLFKQFGLKKKRIRPDYVIVPTDNQLVAAVVEAKGRHSSLESHLRHASQVIIQQMITQAPWGFLTDGERWTLFRGDDSIMHLDSLEDVRRGMNDFRNLVGAQSVRNQLIHKQTLTVLLLSDTFQDSLQDSELFEKLRGRFPRLDKANFRVVSQASVEYNSPAAAAGDRQRWWWPDQTGWYYWPSGVKRTESLSAFIDDSYRMSRSRGRCLIGEKVFHNNFSPQIQEIQFKVGCSFLWHITGMLATFPLFTFEFCLLFSSDW